MAPLLVAVTVAVTVTSLHRRVRPRLAAILLTGAIVAGALAVVPATFVLATGFLAHLPLFGGGFEWCRVVLGFHADVDPWLGAAGLVVLVVGMTRGARVVRGWRRQRRVDAGPPMIVEDGAWFAYALPGPGGRVVVSSGLAAVLDRRALEVVLAHEREHVRHHHDRYLLVANLAAAWMPLLEPLRRRLRFALERWADEAAVLAVGGDRREVATTLARVALGPATPHRGVAGFGGLGVSARVDALISPRTLRFEPAWTSAIAAGVAMTGGAAAVQFHHVLGLLSPLCPH